MKKLSIVILLMVVGCASNPNDYTPDQVLSKDGYDQSKPAIEFEKLPEAFFEERRFVIRTTGATQWGKWQKDWTDCPKGLIAVGFSLSIESKQGKDDDTSVNGVSLYCSTFDERDVSKMSVIKGKSSPWGKDKPPQFCQPGSAIYGLKIGFEPHQKDGDDTAMNSLSVNCKKKSDWRISKDWVEIKGPWAKKYTTKAFCPGNFYVSGLIVKNESRQGRGDDTATNEVAFNCSSPN